jgi:hypothetical protein
MSNLFPDLFFVAIGAMMAPIYAIIVLLLLNGDRGLLKASLFVTGAVAVRLVQGVIFGMVFGPAAEAESAAGLALIGPTLLTVLGILLLVMGVKKWRKESTDEDGNEPPKWMDTLTDMTPLRALGTGALLMVLSVKQWAFTLTAIGLLQEARLGVAAGVSVYLLYTLVSQLLALPAVLAIAFAPEKSTAPLNAALSWLQRHNRVIMVVVSLVFGVYFLYKGISGLLYVVNA